MKTLRVLPFVTAFLLIAAWSPQAAAQTEFGLRIGATIDPDQVHFGFHVRPPRLSDRVRIRPSFELGLGDDLTIGAANFDVVYELTDDDLRPYFGAGPGLALVDRDPPRGDDSDLEAGLNLVAGLEWGPAYRYLVEFRAGFGDLPEVKFTFGFML